MSRRRDQTAPPASATFMLLGAMFLLSGMVALIYEAAWQRQFTLLFGSAAPATAVVLAAYFAGLGLGSLVMGKLGARWRMPLRVYGVLELVIAAGALLVAPALSLYEAFYASVFARFGDSGAWFLALKGVLAFAAIVIPTMAMGGTLPVLAQLFEGRRSQLGDRAGWLYMLNTSGAAAGVLVFPLLLGTMGMRNTAWLCAGLNAAIGIAALLLARADSREFRNSAPEASSATTVSCSRWMVLAFVSGFVTFVLQVGWSRAFGLIHENSVYSFSLIVALFIAAIAAGTQLARILLRRGCSPRTALGGLWLGGGFLTLLGPVIFARMSDGLTFAADPAGGSVFSWHLIRPALVVIFVPVVLLAAGLPLILQSAADSSDRPAGELTGTILAWNITGSVVGAVAAGFLFPYTLGLWRTIAITAAVVLVIASFLPRLTPTKRSALTCACVVCSWLVWRRDLPVTHVGNAGNEKLVSVKEGPYGVAAVLERPGSKRLKLNNHYTLGGTSSTGDERMQSHIPLLLHPGPESVAYLGYGTGITAGAAVFHQPQRTSGAVRDDGTIAFHVTALELVPEVAEMAREFFAAENEHFATQPWAELVIDDARNYLRGTTRTFDVIVGDLVVPWRHGEGALYTLEHFAAARARLAPGGLFCAWLPMFQLGEEDFHTLVRTFLEQFPRAYVWRGDFSPTEPALALIGFVSADIDPAGVSRRLEQMQPDPVNPQLKHTGALWMHLIGIVERRDSEAAELNTEDRPRLELRLDRPLPFTGRRLQAWESQVRTNSAAALTAVLPPDALTGWEAGGLMKEFTLLVTEGNEAAASAVLQQLRATLGEEAARSIFGD